MINFLVGALLLDLAEVDDVGGDADADSDGAFEIRLHLDELAVVVHVLKGQLLFGEVFLVLKALSPVNRELFDLSSVLLINLICEFLMLVRQVLL